MSRRCRVLIADPVALGTDPDVVKKFVQSEDAEAAAFLRLPMHDAEN